jgi:hypothetical protein
MARKAKAPKESTETIKICNTCGRNYKFKLSEFSLAEITSRMISHYEGQHSDRMAYCFDQYGQTWNAQYDAVLKALHETSRQRDEAVKQRDGAAAQQRSLAAKLNAIVLVLRND